LVRYFLLLYIFLTLSGVYAQEWGALNAEGLQYYRNGKYSEAEIAFRAALERAKGESGEVSDPFIHSLNNLAFVYKASGNYNEAKEAFQRSITLLEKLHTSIHVDIIEGLTNLGNLYLETGQYDSSEIYFQYALQKTNTAVKNRDDQYLKSINQFVLVGINLQNGLASLHRRKGEIQDAIDILKQQLTYVKSILIDAPQLQQSYNTILLNLSSCYLESNKPLEAKALMKEYASMPKSSDEEQTSDYLLAIKTLGDVYRQSEQLDSALLMWNAALRSIDKGFFQGSSLHLSLLNNIGELYVATEDYVLAIEKLFLAQRLNETRGGINPRLYQTTLYNLAEAYHWSGNYALADTVYQELMARLLHEVQHNFTYLSESEKISFYRGQLLILESYTSFALTISGVVPLQQTDHLYINKSITQQLYDLQIMTKGIILNASFKMKSRILNGNDESLKTKYLLWETKKNQFANVVRTENPDPDQLVALEEHIDFLEQELSRASASFRKGFVVNSISWREIQNKLKPGEAAVEMIRFVNGLLYGALIITSETKDQPVLAIIKSSGNRYLEKEYYRQYKNSIEHRLVDTVSYNVYWRPILDAARAAMPRGQKLNRVYLSPDGIYNQINLNTLYSNKEKQFVIDQVELRYVVNTKAIAMTEVLKKSKDTAVLFGRPNFELSEYTDLPGTEVEVDQIDQYLRKHKYNSRTYKGIDATESNVKGLSSPHILHLATHGFFENNSESSISLIRILLNSGIVLTPSPIQEGKNVDDGILTAYEALNLNLDTNELTVLSACETGLGEFYPGEGVYGLRLALASAGARHVLMSLWKVDDQATQALMTLFYKHWLKKPENIRAAFQIAQRELRKKYPEPYYWGAFVLIGK
jgi:CHAT domain-containing protein